MKKSTLLISSIALSTVLAFGQNNRKALPLKTHTHQIDQQAAGEMIQNAKRTPSGHIRCLTTEMEALRRMADPSIPTQEEYRKWLDKIVKENQNNPSAKKATRNIPIVVHVIHNGDALGSGENISDAQVISQVDILNQDFSATNSDFGNTPSIYQSVAANMDFQFCMATEDPTGNPTNGIDRVNYGTASFGNAACESMKAATQWDPTRYFNIWVVRFGGDMNGVLGYAQFPNSGSANTDGLVVAYNAYGNTGAAQAPYNKGRTATHEIGHCFGLYHIWGDDGTACTGSDGVADTPNQADENYGCPNFATNTSCSNSGDMSMNYMDYTDDACMYMFTNGQKAVVDAVFNSAPRRASLLTSTVCGVAAISANFTGNPLVINEGQTVTFTDASLSPDNLNSWVWNFPGGTPNTFNGQTPPAITYNTAGQYDVTLTVGDDNGGSDMLTRSLYVTVNPAGTITCDSTIAGWDWNTEGFGGAYWSADLCTPQDGYIMGNNCYDDNGWASIVPFSGSGKELTDVMYVFVQSSGTGATTLKIWNADGAGFDAANGAISTAPGTIMAQASVTSGQFSANLNQFIAVPISPAIPLTGPFYIGYDHPSAPSAGDTLAMGLATGTAGNTTWANEAGIGWRDIAFWGVDYKGTVVAVICDIATGEKEWVGANIDQTVVAPNPTTGAIKVALPTKGNASIDVFNMIGDRVYSTSTTSNYVNFDLSDQPNGVYFVKVTSNGQVTTQKVLLAK
ncbi:MAG: T9SS type A sorting domain-containing protein [Flavobacteriales bacterium]|nr:T9SS type A sorting domain-containing protein [Flavobacteriales bacterium]